MINSHLDYEIAKLTKLCLQPFNKGVNLRPFIGGAENILEVDNCITRLRLSVKDSAAADSDKLKQLGAAGVVPIGKGGLQVIVGLGKVDKVAEQMKKALAS